jgi:hypothetical protein
VFGSEATLWLCESSIGESAVVGLLLIVVLSLLLTVRLVVTVIVTSISWAVSAHADLVQDFLASGLLAEAAPSRCVGRAEGHYVVATRAARQNPHVRGLRDWLLSEVP